MPPSHSTADAARPALVALAAYLLVQLLAVLVGQPDPFVPLLAAHLTGLALVAAAIRASADRWWALRAWLPLVALPMLYAELAPLIASLHQSTRDLLVLRWEAALFGAPARDLAARAPSAVLSEVLHLGYLSYYPLIFVPPIVLTIRGRREALGQTVLALTLAWAACFLVFTAFPVEGPRYRFGAAAGAPPGLFRDLARSLLEQGSSRGTAFPSSHVAVSVAQSLLALRHQRGVGVAACACTVGIAAGAVYGGFHYAVDVAAGALVGALAAVAATFRAPRTSRTPRAPRPA